MLVILSVDELERQENNSHNAVDVWTAHLQSL